MKCEPSDEADSFSYLFKAIFNEACEFSEACDGAEVVQRPSFTPDFGVGGKRSGFSLEPRLKREKKEI